MISFCPFVFPMQVVLTLVGLFAVGCQRTSEIDTYTTAPTDRVEADAAVPADGPDAMLAAIVPREKGLWFFKLSGPSEAVAGQRETFLKLIGSIKFGGRMPAWETPEGWVEEKGDRMRLATLRPPEDVGPLELAISTLPRPGVPLGDLVGSNVNRWRRQLQLRPIRQVAIADAMERVSTQDDPAMVFFLTGKLSADGPQTQGKPAAGQLPAGHPAVPTGAQPPTAARPGKPAAEKPGIPLTFQAPEDWQEGPRNAFRRASFLISEEKLRAEVRVSDFPTKAGPQITSLAANLNRWRGEIGLAAEKDKEAAEAAYEAIEIGGIPAHYVALDGPDDSTPTRATRVAMVTRGDRIWFFKLAGQRSLVEKETERFREFLATVKFDNEKD